MPVKYINTLMGDEYFMFCSYGTVDGGTW